MENNKKIIAGIIAILIIVLSVIAFLIFSNNEESGGNTINNQNPFGSGGSDNNTSAPNQNGFSFSNGEFTAPPQSPFATEKILNLVSDLPSSAGTFYVVGSSTIVTYVDRATGHVYETDLETGSRKRKTNTTIPKIMNVSWRDASFFVAQTLDQGQKESFTGIIPATSTSTDIDGELTRKGVSLNIDFALFSPDKKNGLYGTRTGGEMRLFLGDRNLEKGSLLWNFPTSEWVIEWPKEGILSLQTKPSHGEPGFLFTFDIKTKSMYRIIGEIPALTAKVSPSGDQVFYSSSRDNSSFAFVYDSKNRAGAQLNIVTFADKCTWFQSNLYCAVPKNETSGEMPDLWYRGETAFKDSLWEITFDGENVREKEVADISDLASGDIDAINLLVSPDGKKLLFSNRIDSRLWVLSLDKTN